MNKYVTIDALAPGKMDFTKQIAAYKQCLLAERPLGIVHGIPLGDSTLAMIEQREHIDAWYRAWWHAKIIPRYYRHHFRKHVTRLIAMMEEAQNQ